MSLAPASSRGAFLKARLAVNGIQCAARSFGTLTAVGVGLLSSMGASCVRWDQVLPEKLSASWRKVNAGAALFALNRAVLRAWLARERSLVLTCFRARTGRHPRIKSEGMLRLKTL